MVRTKEQQPNYNLKRVTVLRTPQSAINVRPRRYVLLQDVSTPEKGGDPDARSRTSTLLRLHPNHGSYLKRLPLSRVSLAISSTTHFRDVTGGVYKARERIHRCLLISDY